MCPGGAEKVGNGGCGLEGSCCQVTRCVLGVGRAQDVPPAF